ncbi:MAG: hypothetical protein LBR24_03970 [Methanobrevibacter sp.]|nr:hypothetical protein [Methanobrevibacter sp.]
MLCCSYVSATIYNFTENDTTTLTSDPNAILVHKGDVIVGWQQINIMRSLCFAKALFDYNGAPFSTSIATFTAKKEGSMVVDLAPPTGGVHQGVYDIAVIP